MQHPGRRVQIDVTFIGPRPPLRSIPAHSSAGASATQFAILMTVLGGGAARSSEGKPKMAIQFVGSFCRGCGGAEELPANRRSLVRLSMVWPR